MNSPVDWQAKRLWDYFKSSVHVMLGSMTKEFQTDVEIN
jgi:hypothetical protein